VRLHSSWSSSTASTAILSAWYRDHARDALVRLGAGIVDELDATSTKDGPSLALPICVVGVAGVGKSTLLNALLSDRLSLLPQGGVGSFTSTPVRIVHADDPYLAIRRHRDAATRLLTELGREGARASVALQEARLLVRGGQFDDASAEYLLEVLEVAAQGRVSERAAIRDRGRLSVLAGVLADERPDAWKTWSAGLQLPQLRHELEHNAAGFLSPLAAEVELGWTAELLGGLQLIDLPGLGVANDALDRQTRRWLEVARSVLLVVERSGITEGTADALRPVLSRWVEDADADWSRLLVAITHLDQIACDRRAREPTEVRRTWQAHFDDLGDAAQQLVRGQLAQQLAAIGLGGESHRGRRTDIASRIQIIPVAPLEHRRYHRRDLDERGYLTEEGGGGVPRLRRELVALGWAWADSAMSRLLGALERALGSHSSQFLELRRALQLLINRHAKG
jgi:Dynamin family